MCGCDVSADQRSTRRDGALRRCYGDISRLDRILEADGDEVSRYRPPSRPMCPAAYDPVSDVVVAAARAVR